MDGKAKAASVSGSFYLTNHDAYATLNGQRVKWYAPYWALTIMIRIIMIVFFFTQRILDAV